MQNPGAMPPPVTFSRPRLQAGAGFHFRPSADAACRRRPGSASVPRNPPSASAQRGAFTGMGIGGRCPMRRPRGCARAGRCARHPVSCLPNVAAVLRCPAFLPGIEHRQPRPFPASPPPAPPVPGPLRAAAIPPCPRGRRRSVGTQPMSKTRADRRHLPARTAPSRHPDPRTPFTDGPVACIPWADSRHRGDALPEGIPPMAASRPQVGR
jgi:hypothetical protein